MYMDVSLRESLSPIAAKADPPRGVNLARLIEAAASRLSALARARGVRMSLRLDGTIGSDVDWRALRASIETLLTATVGEAARGSIVWCELARVGDEAVVRILEPSAGSLYQLQLAIRAR